MSAGECLLPVNAEAYHADGGVPVRMMRGFEGGSAGSNSEFSRREQKLSDGRNGVTGQDIPRLLCEGAQLRRC